MRVVLWLLAALLATPHGGAQEAASAQQPGPAELASAASARAVSASGAAAEALPDAASLLPAAQAAHASALRLRHAVARRRWKADLVVVVTWFNKSIDWLATAFPLEHTSFVLYSKGGLKRCDTDIPAALAHAVVACHEVHNAGGREAHTVAQFIVSHYHNLPRLTYFAQDDLYYYTKTAALRNITSAAAFEAWVALAEAQPFSNMAACLCYVITEQPWTLERYGAPLYVPMRWFMEAFLGFDVATSNWTAVRWPANADLVVPAAVIRGRSLELYKIILFIFNGTAPAVHDIIALDSKLVVSDAVRFVPMLQMAHVFERLWFAVFDVHYSPSQADYDARALAAAEPAAGAGEAAAARAAHKTA